MYVCIIYISTSIKPTGQLYAVTIYSRYIQLYKIYIYTLYNMFRLNIILLRGIIAVRILFALQCNFTKTTRQFLSSEWAPRHRTARVFLIKSVPKNDLGDLRRMNATPPQPSTTQLPGMNQRYHPINMLPFERTSKTCG